MNKQSQILTPSTPNYENTLKLTLFSFTSFVNLYQVIPLIYKNLPFDQNKRELGDGINNKTVDQFNSSLLIQKMNCKQINLSLISKCNSFKVSFLQFISKNKYHLLSIQARAGDLNIDLSQVPIGLYSSDLLGDLSQHLGWLEGQLGDLSQKSSSQFQCNVKKWISSPSQKIDLWEVSISVDQREGSIYKLDQETNTFTLLNHKQIKENFLSHLSIGHHSQLAANYQSNHKQKRNSVVNQCIFNFQSLKKFCCLGNPSLEASTGIVSIHFQDEKGATQQITKELMQNQSKKGVMTLVFSNIDRFQGLKLKGGRMNDARLEIGVFQSRDQYRLICSAGQINLKFKAQQVFVQVNSSCLRLLCPKDMKITLQRKMKVLINKETLEC